MRRNVSSRLFSSTNNDSLSSSSDEENPSDQHQIIRRQRSLFSSRPGVPVLISVIFYTVLLSLLCLFLCGLFYSLRSTLLCVGLAVATILFKTAPRTNLWLFCKEKRIFLDIKEMWATKKSISNGLGVEFLDDGTYSGEFKKGMRTGKGVMEKPGKLTYGGDWVEGFYDGYGVENLSGDSMYKGQFVKGVRSGYGCMQFANGDQYNGEWLYGQRHGMGEQTSRNGDMYVGQFKQDMRHGLGAENYNNGDRYLGEYFNDMRLGVGVYIFSSGDRYEGSWHDDFMEGYGVHSKIRDNEIQSGSWIKGDLTVGMPIYEHNVAKSVQAAKDAARSSTELGSANDQVLKAIAEADNANESAKLASDKAHFISGLHPFDPRRLAARVSLITESFQALRRPLGNFGRSFSNVAGFVMTGRLTENGSKEEIDRLLHFV